DERGGQSFRVRSEVELVVNGDRDVAAALADTDRSHGEQSVAGYDGGGQGGQLVFAPDRLKQHVQGRIGGRWPAAPRGGVALGRNRRVYAKKNGQRQGQGMQSAH